MYRRANNVVGIITRRDLLPDSVEEHFETTLGQYTTDGTTLTTASGAGTSAAAAAAPLPLRPHRTSDPGAGVSSGARERAAALSRGLGKGLGHSAGLASTDGLGGGISDRSGISTTCSREGGGGVQGQMCEKQP